MSTGFPFAKLLAGPLENVIPLASVVKPERRR
jgi:hypothetical protein